MISKNKKIVISVIIFLIILISIVNINFFRSTVKSLISPENREKVKRIILGNKTVEYYKALEKKSSINYNQKLLPNSEFINLSFKDFSLEELITKDERSIETKYFIEEFNDDLIIVDFIGNIFFINKNIIKDFKNFDSKKINSNIDFKNKLIRDILVVDDKIYISLAIIVDDKNQKITSESLDKQGSIGKCQKIGIYSAKISKEKLNFTNLFISEECKIKFNAGRIKSYTHNNKKGLLLSTDADTSMKYLAQDENSLFGKILFIDFEKKKPLVFSKGHRVPQGLLVDDNRIIATEHGPRGGDEINLIEYGNNYGWPIASYGEPYEWQKKNTERIHYLKNHDKNGFIEPIISFVPSIAISEIIKVPDKFSIHWKNSYLVSTLGGKVVYRVLLDKNLSKVINYEKIYIGKRIRDLIYIEDYNVFILALEGSGDPNQSKTPSIGILGFKDFLYN